MVAVFLFKCSNLFGFLKLDDNRLWIMGGQFYWWGSAPGNQFPSYDTTVIFDGRDSTWGPGPVMSKLLTSPRAVHIGDSKYLIISGKTWSGPPTNSKLWV